MVLRWIVSQKPEKSFPSFREYFPILRISLTWKLRNIDPAIFWTSEPSATKSLRPFENLGAWVSTELLLPVQTFCLPESEQGRGHLDRHVWTASLPRSLPFRFPKNWCAHRVYNEEGFVCWRIFSALLLNSKVRRGWGPDENYSPLPAFTFPNIWDLSFVCSCLEMVNGSFKNKDTLHWSSGCDQRQVISFLWTRDFSESLYLFNEDVKTIICASSIELQTLQDTPHFTLSVVRKINVME